MSVTINHPEDFCRVQRLVSGQSLFGSFIQKAREKRGCTVEEVAPLAGMEPSEWLAVEAGGVPETAAQLRLMAAALQFSKVQLATVVQICRAAWTCRAAWDGITISVAGLDQPGYWRPAPP